MSPEPTEPDYVLSGELRDRLGTSFDFLEKKQMDFALNSDWLGVVRRTVRGKIMALTSHEIHSFSDLLEWPV